MNSPAMLFLTRFLGGALNGEINDNDNWIKNYGGGFEFTFLKPGGGFRKLSYRIDYFGDVGEDLGHFGTNYFCYFGRHLVLLSIFPLAPDHPGGPKLLKGEQNYSFRWRSIPGVLDIPFNPRAIPLRNFRADVNLAFTYWQNQVSLDWPNSAPIGIRFRGARLTDPLLKINLDISKEFLQWKAEKIARFMGGTT